MSTQEQQLCQLLLELPARHKYRYGEEAERDLLTGLFWCMAGGRDEYMNLFFPTGGPLHNGTLRLREAQGAVDGAEYTEGARGKACGHNFHAGEPCYLCKTCAVDDTCVMCSKCFEASDHAGHHVRLQISGGNGGCCDCGDPEAWKRQFFCTIHSSWEAEDKGKGKQPSPLPEDLVNSIRMTIARVLDFMCDVISCSPEQLRQSKTCESIRQDERMSRLSETYCGGDTKDPGEYCVLLWNDEKHTIYDVQHQVARACRTSLSTGLKKAMETDLVGRTILEYNSDLTKLIDIATVIEQIRVTVTIRSSRDTFREYMVNSLVEWLKDISLCSVGEDLHILRQTVCEELLKPWRRGSPGTHSNVGQDGIDDEDRIERELEEQNSEFIRQQQRILLQARQAAQAARAREQAGQGGQNNGSDDDEDEDEEEEEEEEEEDMGDVDMDEDGDEMFDDDDILMLENRPEGGDEGEAGGEDGGEDVHMQDWRQDQASGAQEDERLTAGAPTNLPPPPGSAAAALRRAARERELTPSDSDTAEPLIAPSVFPKTNLEIPKTPHPKGEPLPPPPKPGHYWVLPPSGYVEQDHVPVAENMFERLRLDWLLLFDPRMWKQLRNNLKSLYIQTLLTIPEYKRILGLRFAGLYTTLSQLYLVGDREPDHSVIHLSLQLMTTPSITAQIVERANFLTTLMAILYTFLTTRQVGHPWEVDSNAVIAFDSGVHTNRRVYYIFTDIKYLVASADVQERLRTEERYMLQFLDLVKLHQGVCPNVRAVEEHVEYEADNWISASLIMQRTNRMCKMFAQAFQNVKDHGFEAVSNAIRLTAKSVIINSIGAERTRFSQCEIKDEVRFKILDDFEFEPAGRAFKVVKFVVEEEPMSFHHPLHHFLSWLIEYGKTMPLQQLRSLLSFTTEDLVAKPRSMGKKVMPRHADYTPEDYLMAAFDFPLRVCVWLAQMKAGMWVRNGMSLRHQAGTYRGVTQRDVTYHRDIFLLQTALVVCDPSRVLASMVDRFGMEKWCKGIFEQKVKAQDDSQHLDVVEDMIHLLIVLLSDRTMLIPSDEGETSERAAIRRDLVHILCFKPLTFSEICSKLPDKVSDREDIDSFLDEMTTFKAPEGLNDVGLFELKPEFYEEIDPYITHYNKTHREEAEMAYRKAVAKKTGKSVDDIIYEPKLKPITSGIFTRLAEFTGTGVFAQVIYYSLLYTLKYQDFTPSIQATRVETFLQMLLHLIMCSIMEDKTTEQDGEEVPSFVVNALIKQARSNFMAEHANKKSIVALLDLLLSKDDFKACHQKIIVILRRMHEKRPRLFEQAYEHLGLSLDHITAEQRAASAADEERERKKKAALERQKRVMAQFQAQQKSFMEKQGDIDWGEFDDLDEDEELPPVEEHKKWWKYPAGTCILCQEETDDRRLYGTFAFFTESCILRQTDFQDPAFVREVIKTPENLDRSADSIRPFGIASENVQKVQKINQDGETFEVERQGIARGFPAKLSRPGPVAVGCGHIMHYGCFEAYYESTLRRHTQQIARHHPEDITRLEFVCPLCKALNNAFLPIVWKGKEEAYPGPLVPTSSFTDFLDHQLRSAYYTLGANRPADGAQEMFRSYTTSQMMTSIAEKVDQLEKDAWESQISVSGPAATNPLVQLLGLTMQVSEPQGAGGGGAGVGSQGGSNQQSNKTPIRELVRVYRRLRDTLRRNGLKSKYNWDDDSANELYGSDVLARAVGFSISAVEIQQRGVEAEYGSTFLERIPTQVLTQLRILAETVTSFIAVGGQRDQGDNRIDTEYHRDSERQHCQMFMTQYLDEETETTYNPAKTYPPLLSLDPFVYLCECVFGVVPAQDFEIAHMVRLCYLAEIVKVVYHLARNTPAMTWIKQLMHRDNIADPAVARFAQFCDDLFHMDIHSAMHYAGGDESTRPGATENRAFDQPGLDSWEGWYKFLRKYALVFLRKCVVLLHVKFGVDFNSRVSPRPELPELERLTEMLRLPSLEDMLTALNPEMCQQFGWPADTRRLVEGWMNHQALWPYNGSEEQLPTSAVVSHPAIFELLGLPKHFDSLIQEASKRRCPTTGGGIADPMICLFCGEIFCGQTVCCIKEFPQTRHSSRMLGGAQQHMMK